MAGLLWRAYAPLGGIRESSLFSWLVAIPMWFGGGLIPTYIVIQPSASVKHTAYFALIGLVSSFNIIICRTFLASLPYELQEAAKDRRPQRFCDTAQNPILPLSKPILAVLCLYYAVGHWNDYFNAMIYVNNKKLSDSAGVFVGDFAAESEY